MALLLTIRDMMREKSPPWLRGRVGERFMYAVGVQFDAFVDAAVGAVKTRFPGLYHDDSLPYLGRDRRITRGRNETSAVFAVRLRRWLDDHRTRGGPYAMLAQLFAYYADAPVAMQLVYRSGRRYTMDVVGAVTRSDSPFAPDADALKWARWWLFMDWPDAIPPARTYGDGLLYGTDAVYGSGLTPAEVADIRLVPKAWNAAHAMGRIVLVPTGSFVYGSPPELYGTPGLVYGGPAGAALSVD